MTPHSPPCGRGSCGMTMQAPACCSCGITRRVMLASPQALRDDPNRPTTVRPLSRWLALAPRTPRLVAVAAFLLCHGDSAAAQAPEQTLSALERWLALDAPTSDETRATEAIVAADPGWRRDALGNLTRS